MTAKSVLEFWLFLNMVFSIFSLVILAWTYPNNTELMNIMWGTFGLGCLNMLLVGAILGVHYD